MKPGDKFELPDGERIEIIDAPIVTKTTLRKTSYGEESVSEKTEKRSEWARGVQHGDN